MATATIPLTRPYKLHDFVEYMINTNGRKVWKTGYIAEVISPTTVRVMPDDPREDTRNYMPLENLRLRDYYPGDSILVRNAYGTFGVETFTPGTILHVENTYVTFKPNSVGEVTKNIQRDRIHKNLVNERKPTEHNYVAGDKVEYRVEPPKLSENPTGWKEWVEAEVVEVPAVSQTHVKLNKQGWVKVSRIRRPAVNTPQPIANDPMRAYLRKPAESSPLKTQVGSSHYKDMKIQPIEYILANNLAFIEGAVVKYVSRWREKNEIEDLKKARHFLDILIADEEKKANE